MRGTGPSVHDPDLACTMPLFLRPVDPALPPHKRKEWTTAELQKGGAEARPVWTQWAMWPAAPGVPVVPGSPRSTTLPTANSGSASRALATSRRLGSV